MSMVFSKLKNQDPTFLKIVFSFIGIIILILVILVIQTINNYTNYLNSPAREIENQQTTITNLSELLKGKTTDEDMTIYIQHGLYDIIQRNNQDINPSNITDAKIRDDTFKYEDEKSGLHTVSFLVDIPSLQQTYDIQYQWNTINHGDVSEYGTFTKCPTISQLIYPAFDCTDDFIEMDSDIAPSGDTFMVKWTNLYQLDYVFSIETSIKIRAALENFLLSFSGFLRATATVVESTFHTVVDQPNYTYSFDAKINDDTTINIIIRIDEETMGNNYIVIYTKNPITNEQLATIITDNSEYISDLGTWLRSYLNLPDLPITVQTPADLGITNS